MPCCVIELLMLQHATRCLHLYREDTIHRLGAKPTFASEGNTYKTREAPRGPGVSKGPAHITMRLWRARFRQPRDDLRAFDVFATDAFGGNAAVVL